MSEILITSIFEGIYSDLIKMEEEKKVDPLLSQLISKLDSLKDVFKKYKEKALKERGLTNKEGYTIYSTSKNAESVLEKMQERFKIAKEMQDNPKVVLDALPIIEILKETTISIDKSFEGTVGIDANLKNKLRKIAKQNNMIASLEYETNKMDKKKLTNTFLILSNNLEYKN